MFLSVIFYLLYMTIILYAVLVRQPVTMCVLDIHDEKFEYIKMEKYQSVVMVILVTAGLAERL